MVCPQCNNGFLCPSLPIPSVLSYRRFEKVVGTFTLAECSNGCTASTDSLNSIVDMDAEMNLFKREINARLSIGDEL